MIGVFTAFVAFLVDVSEATINVITRSGTVP
jgi:hypothetical protein